MNTFENESYINEVKEKWGQTVAYNEYTENTKDASEDKLNSMGESLEKIFAEFAECMKNGASPESSDAQSLVEKLKNYITENFYTCTNEILAGLGQMYVADERFKNNIDKYSVGTADFVSRAIEIYCKK